MIDSKQSLHHLGGVAASADPSGGEAATRRRPTMGRRSCVRRTTPAAHRAPRSYPWARPSPSTAKPATSTPSRTRSRRASSLTGTEIKSIRAGKVNLGDAYARIEKRRGLAGRRPHRALASGNRYNHEPRRDRKLLLHRTQIDQLLGKTKAKGLTIVPLRLYINDRGRAKVELGLARGKQLHDRRRDIADRDARRDMERELADVQRGRR